MGHRNRELTYKSQLRRHAVTKLTCPKVENAERKLTARVQNEVHNTGKEKGDCQGSERSS